MLVNCSERNPAYFASTPVNSWVSANISFCRSFVNPSRFCCFCNNPIRLSRLAFSFFSPSSSTFANSSLAAIRSLMVFVSSSRICLCFSAIRSYFSTIPVYKIPRRSILYSAVANTSRLSKASLVDFAIVLKTLTAASPGFFKALITSNVFFRFCLTSLSFSFSKALICFCTAIAPFWSF